MEEYTTTHELLRFAVGTAARHGRISRGDIVLVLTGAPGRPGRAAPDVVRIVPVT